MKYSKLLKLISFLVAVVTFSSCEKEQQLNENVRITKMKVFNDTTASAENASIRIAAGYDKLFMVYGCGAPFALIAGSLWTLNYQAKIISSDFNGELKWQNSIDINLDVYDIIALDDGGCLTVSFNYWGNLNHTQKHIFLNRFDGKGNSILADSVLLPASLSTDYNLLSVGGCRSATGNILLYGTIYDINDPINSIKPFAGEYSLTGGWNWIKWYKLLNATNESSTIISAIVIDNGYLFSVSANEYAPSTNFNALMLKTNLSGDTLWTCKQQAVTDVWIGSSSIAYNGNIYFGYSLGDGGKFSSYISRFDANGQLLNTISVSGQNNNFITSVKITDSGSVTALSNRFGNTLNSYTDPIFTATNTQYLKASDGISISSQGPLQSETSDFIPVSCSMPNNKTACFGLIQIKGREYYKPALMIIE